MTEVARVTAEKASAIGNESFLLPQSSLYPYTLRYNSQKMIAGLLHISAVLK